MSYSCMYLVPKGMYDKCISDANETLKNKLNGLNVHQQNNYEVNDNGKVTVRNDMSSCEKKNQINGETKKNTYNNDNHIEQDNPSISTQDQYQQSEIKTSDEITQTNFPQVNQNTQTEFPQINQNTQTIIPPQINQNTQTEIFSDNKNTQTHFPQNDRIVQTDSIPTQNNFQRIPTDSISTQTKFHRNYNNVESQTPVVNNQDIQTQTNIPINNTSIQTEENMQNNRNIETIPTQTIKKRKLPAWMLIGEMSDSEEKNSSKKSSVKKKLTKTKLTPVTNKKINKKIVKVKYVKDADNLIWNLPINKTLKGVEKKRCGPKKCKKKNETAADLENNNDIARKRTFPSYEAIIKKPTTPLKKLK